MIPSYYLAVTSMLVHGSCAGYVAACQRGRWAEAGAAAARAADVAPSDQLPLLLQGCADACVLTSDFEEAEQWYRRSTRRVELAHEAQALSRRGAGIQAWFLNRLETAASCFTKSSQHAATPQLRMEALVHLSALCASAGLLELAQQAARRLDAMSEAEMRPAWRAVARLLQEEVAAVGQMYCVPGLRDDSYWVTSTGIDMPRLQPDSVASHGQIGAVESLLSDRRRVLRALVGLAKGDFAHFEVLRDALRSANHSTADYRDTLTLEIVKACIGGGHMHSADGLLRTLRSGTLEGAEALDASRHRLRETAYCLYKLRLFQGRPSEAMDHFSRYASYAMGDLRRDGTCISRIVSQEFPASDPAKDEVSSRLPARYRRAYEFMLRSIDRSDLSIQEVASSIGVTERSLQVTFKLCLGESPRQVLQRLRLQRIREALRRNVDTNVSIMDVASKYGIANRTSLLVGFRRYFQEAPSETLSGHADQP